VLQSRRTFVVLHIPVVQARIDGDDDDDDDDDDDCLLFN